MPERIQLQRTRGWRKPEGAVVVARPSPWGNPFAVGDFFASRTWAHDRPDPRGDRGEPGTYHRHSITNGPWVETIGVVRDRAHAVELFRAYIAYEDLDWAPEKIRAALYGHDLCCWCPPAEPCHADVLLAIANNESAVGGR
jgi:hypothetical protein